MKTYTFEDGKYEYDRSDIGTIVAARRHGEPWPAGLEAVQFSKSFGAVLNRIDELEAVSAEVHSWIVCAAFASNEDLRLNAVRIEAITRPADVEPPEPIFPPTGTDCSICCEPQFTTVSGVSCVNGHGGVEPLI